MAKQQRKQISARGASMAEQQVDTVYNIVDVVGVSEKSWETRGPQRRGNGSRLAARPARSRSDENGHEGGEREGHGLPHPRVALLQVRSLIGSGVAELVRPREKPSRESGLK